MKFSFETIEAEKLEEIRVMKERRSLISAIETAKKRGHNPVIAEIKRRSPSAGRIRDADVAETAKKMESAGACAISVLSDKRFGGCVDDLVRVKAAVRIPVLRKDFIVDEFQLYQSYAYGADAVLLIVALLREKTKAFVDLIHNLGMEALIEIHSEDELRFVLDSGARLVGINNRDLETMETELGTTESLTKKIPKNKLIISESGIKNAEDLRRAFNAGADAALIGTSIMQAKNIREKVREFVG